MKIGIQIKSDMEILENGSDQGYILKGKNYRLGSEIIILEIGLQISDTFLNENIRDWVTEQEYILKLKYQTKYQWNILDW